jgi:putative acyl-CoA dehydrogenase
VVDALHTELAASRGRHPLLDRFAGGLLGRLDEAADGETDETQARRLAGDVALVLQCSLLQRHAPAPVFEAFCAARLAPQPASVFGCLPPGVDHDTIIRRAMPVAAETLA